MASPKTVDIHGKFISPKRKFIPVLYRRIFHGDHLSGYVEPEYLHNRQSDFDKRWEENNGFHYEYAGFLESLTYYFFKFINESISLVKNQAFKFWSLRRERMGGCKHEDTEPYFCEMAQMRGCYCAKCSKCFKRFHKEKKEVY